MRKSTELVNLIKEISQNLENSKEELQIERDEEFTKILEILASKLKNEGLDDENNNDIFNRLKANTEYAHIVSAKIKLLKRLLQD